jgi:Uma2 family endonuclease
MADAVRRRSFTFREYLDLEDASNTKHEYANGEIYAMAGGSPEHAALAVAVAGRLLEALRGGPCRVYSSDLRVRVKATGLATYPDVTVVCGALEHDPESDSTVTNPTVVVEVISPSTAEYDRGEKLDHYQRIPSLGACLFVASDARAVTLVRREGDRWVTESFGRGTSVPLAVLSVTLSVDGVYDDAGVA